MSLSRRSLNTSTLTLALAAALLVPVDGTAAGKQVFFSPASLDFGFNALGEAKTKIATLYNNQTVKLNLYVATLEDNPGGFTIVSTTCGATLAAGQSCKYTLKYTAKTLLSAAARLELTTRHPYYSLLEVPLQANRYPALNDTGITRCSDSNQNSLTCPSPDFPEQDAQFGRDKTRNAASNGKAGFSYTKLDSQGKNLPASAYAWDCVRDNVTGLVWEKKPNGDGTIGNQGLHDADDAYTWYSTDNDNNGGELGYPDQGSACFGYVDGQAASYCNTQAYVKRVNMAGWCGFKDWRLPDRFELGSLVDLSISWPGPTLDVKYFPDTRGTFYWSSSPSTTWLSAWFVDFGSGEFSQSFDRDYTDHAVRLVRGGQ